MTHSVPLRKMGYCTRKQSFVSHASSYNPYPFNILSRSLPDKSTVWIPQGPFSALLTRLFSGHGPVTQLPKYESLSCISCQPSPRAQGVETQLCRPRPRAHSLPRNPPRALRLHLPGQTGMEADDAL